MKKKSVCYPFIGHPPGYQVSHKLTFFQTSPRVHPDRTQAIATVGDTQMLSFIIEFPSSENAEKWYNSEAYQKIVPKRIEMADFHMTVCAGLE